MKDTALITNISSNYIRARQAETEGNDRIELRHLLFAAQEISALLTMWYNGNIDDATAKTYAASLESSAARIKELIERGIRKP